MAIEQYFHEVDGDESPPRKWTTVSNTATESDTAGGSFDCNICLDFALEPVVTLCGHLYCWPCIYKWIHLQRASASTGLEQQQPQCPVCKADISHKTLVPLYGRGQTPTTQTEPKAKGLHAGLEIPRRPPACGVHALIATTTTSATSHSHSHSHGDPQPNPHHGHSQSLSGAFQHHQQYSPYQYRNYTAASPLLNLGGTTITSIFYPMVGMFGEMVFARVFGNSQTSLYAYPNSQYLVGGSGSPNPTPRMRRQEMQIDKSLNRISIFLFCCLVLCLLLF
ncbi:PREDICTED: E3 ubiquitin-protein ligase RMA1H1-like [Nelumbo nucifera]|uniref:E3 ubiquitin-protein ligase RMA n=1 Tax=Nelumbo nucifera TaxID=4432 RepID=A0A1U7Z7G7_NELNU|nr:PREDICTED: E3 ubiquitin-protein ligase RMA1H1-like [Nelumbo nucifera]